MIWGGCSVKTAQGFWTRGYSSSELEAAQDRYELRFPPDLIELLLDRRPVDAPDWRTDETAIRKLIAWPLEGILFDIEHNAFWLSQWGERPHSHRERTEIASKAVAAAPALIPLYSHRFIPSEPHEAGNPVFSIHQTDIIYYGANLAHYFDNEITGWSSLPAENYRQIAFWSDLAG